MSVNLQSTPITNTIEFRATFLRNGVPQATLPSQQAEVLTIVFDEIGLGSSEPLSIYAQETPGNIAIPPGNVAFLERSVDRKIALRYARPGGVQQNIIFELP